MENSESFDREKARALQLLLAKKVVREDSFPTPLRVVGGLDLAYKEGEAAVAYVAFDYPSMKPIYSESRSVTVSVPYIPTFLSFREGPPIIDVIKTAAVKSDIYLINGQGVAHPYRIGLASHVGVLADVATIGVAKSLLCGQVQKTERLRSHIIDGGEIIGAALRPKTNSSLLYVSLGHRISLESSVEIVYRLVQNHSLPEPLWAAHALAKITLSKGPSKTYSQQRRSNSYGFAERNR